MKIIFLKAKLPMKTCICEDYLYERMIKRALLEPHSFMLTLSLVVFLPAPPLFFSPLLSTHSEILTEMLKLAAAISAPALALKALEQEARGRIKEFIRWCASSCTSKHTCTSSHYIPIHFFTPICMAEPFACRQTWLHAQKPRNTNRQSRTFWPASFRVSLSATLPASCALLCKWVTVSVFGLSEWERQAAT